MAVGVVALSFDSFTPHDAIHPPRTYDAGGDITQGAGEINQADLPGIEIVGRSAEGVFETDV